jgi:hypothetical protein
MQTFPRHQPFVGLVPKETACQSFRRLVCVGLPVQRARVATALPHPRRSSSPPESRGFPLTTARLPLPLPREVPTTLYSDHSPIHENFKHEANEASHRFIRAASHEFPTLAIIIKTGLSWVIA